jgi:molybdopterin molybdotransferase
VSSLIPVADALSRLLDNSAPQGVEHIPLHEAAGRVLAAPLLAARNQPPFDASAMDGYAVRALDVEAVPATLRVIGAAVAGKRFAGEIKSGEAVRIFTGAPLPAGSDSILIQENAHTLDEGRIEALEPVSQGQHVRRKGLDFQEGETVLEAGRVLDPAALSLAAAANHPTLPVYARPLVALIATGDELVLPGETPGPDQIVASNGFGIGALIRKAGGAVLDLGVVRDDTDAIAAVVKEARDRGARIIVTMGGASVGEHDLVRAALTGIGMELDFWKIAMRPGKPLMFGRLGDVRVLGLPGNPVSGLVCAHLFLAPLVSRLAGLPYEDRRVRAVLGAAMRSNGDREDYVRARLVRRGDALVATPFQLQDSSMLRTLAASDCLIIRPPHAPSAEAGTQCVVLPIR